MGEANNIQKTTRARRKSSRKPGIQEKKPGDAKKALD
jgi:hypothetical protein